MFHRIQTNVPDSVIHAMQPAFWMDARRAPAGVVTSMPNRGSAGGNFTAPVTGPTKGTNTRGTPTLTFSTAAHRLAIPTYNWGRAVTIVTVEEQTATAIMVSVWVGNAANTDQIFMGRHAAGALDRNVTMTVAVNAVPGPSQSQYMNTNAAYTGVICGLGWWNGVLAAANEQRVEVNGVAVATTVGAAQETSVAEGNVPGWIGAYGENTASFFYQGTISQVLMFNRALSTDECLALYKALRLICNLV